MYFGRYFDDNNLCNYTDVHNALGHYLCADVIAIIWHFTTQLNAEFREEMRQGYIRWWMNTRRVNNAFNHLRREFIQGLNMPRCLTRVNYKIWLECALAHLPSDSLATLIYTKYPRLLDETIEFAINAVPERLVNSPSLNVVRYDLARTSMDSFTIMAIENAVNSSATRYLFNDP